MKRKAVFFDRDNTLIVSDGYLGDPAKVQLVDGAADAVARLRSLGFVTITFSNQSGVARGMFDERAVQAVNTRMEMMLKAGNPAAIIDRHEYCPYHPDAAVERYRQESELRKPAAGMIYRAHQALNLDLAGSWVIGDAPRDIEAGRSAGCRTILVQHPHLPRSPAAETKTNLRPDYTCTGLREAVDRIEQAMRQEKVVSAAVPPVPDLPDDSETSEPQKSGVRQQQIPEQSPVENRLESLMTQILAELRRRNEREHTDFSLAKLLAGIMQVIVLAVLFAAYLNYQNHSALQSLLLLAIAFQLLVLALLLMSRRG